MRHWVHRTPPPRRTGLADISHCKVLVVDDTRTNIDIIVEALRDECRLSVALDGERALAAAHRPRPDLILLDVMMPGMDGYEVAARLQAQKELSEVPIIFITALDDPDDKIRGFEAGAVDYITKPFHMAEVKARVRNHLQLTVSRAQLRKHNDDLESKVRERTSKLERTQLDIISRLGKAAEFRDHETGEHIRRMSIACKLLAKAAGLEKRRANLIWRAATMHDVGKIGISDNILLKPGKLDRAEWDTMKTHTTIGAKLLSGSDSPLLQMAEVIALTHHEKWDGSGYPSGLCGEDIPLEGRIACICDVFDALISERPYKQAWKVDDAIEEVRRQSGKHFDPALVQAFMDIAPKLKCISRHLK